MFFNKNNFKFLTQLKAIRTVMHDFIWERKITGQVIKIQIDINFSFVNTNSYTLLFT